MFRQIGNWLKKKVDFNVESILGIPMDLIPQEFAELEYFDLGRRDPIAYRVKNPFGPR